MITDYLLPASAFLALACYSGADLLEANTTNKLPEVQNRFEEFAKETDLQPLDCSIQSALFRKYIQCDAISIDKNVVSFEDTTEKKFALMEREEKN